MDNYRGDLFPYSEETWAKIVAQVNLSPQHARVAECLFHAMGDKQIAREIEISIPTVRTYLDRIGKQLGVQGRIEIMLKIVAVGEDMRRGRS